MPASAYCRKWNKIYQYRRQDDKPRLMKLLREATAGFVAMADVPAFNFLPELMELYPDAKVVLVTRDPERWWKSFKPVADSCEDQTLNRLVQPLPGRRWYIDTARGYFEEWASQNSTIGSGGCIADVFTVSRDDMEAVRARI